MTLLKRLFDRSGGRDALIPLYNAVVSEARDPAWYLEGGVPDTVDGRFDMVAAILSLAIARLEREGDDGMAKSALLTEVFVDDMDGQLRQIGIGDIVVGKHIGKMMSALGGRLTAYRGALAGEGLEEALRRNLYRGTEPDETAVAFAAARFREKAARIDAVTVDALLRGEI